MASHSPVNLLVNWSQEEHLVILSGHYEGVDQRVRDDLVDEEVSIGDYVLTNGTLAAAVLIDCVSRFIPGFLGDEKSLTEESFMSTLLGFPQYTRPADLLRDALFPRFFYLVTMQLSRSGGMSNRSKKHGDFAQTFLDTNKLKFTSENSAMSQAILEDITKDQLKDDRADFKVGDGVRVHLKVIEGEKTRIQVFAGIVIARKGGGLQETFTVRRIASGVGVEKVFPVHSPTIEKVEVDRESVTMRARMYYMRDRIGKAANQG